MKRWYLPLGLAVGLLLVFVLTPTGPWVIGRFAASAASGAGWEMRIGNHAGSLAGGFSFEGVTASNPEAGIEAAVEKVAVSLWQYTVDIEVPQIVIDLDAKGGEEAEAAAEPFFLPLEYLTDVHLRRGEIQLKGGDWDGRGIGLSADLVGLGDNSAALALSFTQIGFSGAGVSEAEAEFAVRGRVYEDHLAFDTLNVSLRVDSTAIDLHLGGQAHWNDAMPLAVRLEAIAHHGQAISAEAAIDLDGRANPASFDFRLSSRLKHPFVGSAAVPVEGSGSLGDGLVRIDSLVASLWGGQIRLAAAYAFENDSLAVDMDGQDFDLSQVPDMELSGDLAARVRASLNLAQSPIIAAGEADIVLSGVELLPGEKRDLRLLLDLGTNRHLEAELKSQGLAIQASGTAGLDAKSAPEIDLELSGEIIPRQLLRQDFAPVSMQGIIRADSLALLVKTSGVEAAGQTFGPIQVQVELGAWRYLRLHGGMEGEGLRLSAVADVQQGVLDSALIYLDGLPLARLAPGTEGRVRGWGRAEGRLTAEQITAEVVVELEAPAWQGWATDDIHLSASYRDGQVEGHWQADAWEGKMRLDTQTSAVAGDIDFKGRVLRTRNTAQQATGVNYVLMQGKLQLEADLDTVAAARAWLDAERLDLSFNGWRLENDGPLRLGYADGSGHLDRVHLRLPTGPLVLSGGTRGDSLDLSVALDRIDLEVLAPEYRADGKAWMHVGGTVQEPRAAGGLELAQLEFGDLVLGDGQLHFEVADSTEVRLSLADRDGQQHASLEVEMPTAPLLAGIDSATVGDAHIAFSLQPGNLAALLTHLLQQPAQAELDIDGDLHLPLSLMDRPLAWRDLDGSVTVRQAHLQIPLAADSLRLSLTDTARIDLRGDHVVLDGLRIDGQRYDRERGEFLPAGGLDVGGSLYASTPSRLSLEIMDMDLRAVGGPDGSAWLLAEVEGTAADPRLQVDLEVTTFDLGNIKGQVTGDNAGADLHMRWQALGDDSLAVQGRLPWTLQKGMVDWDAGVARFYSTGIGLEIFAEEVAQLDGLGGRLGLDLNVQGFSDSLKTAGFIQADSLHFSLLDIEPTYLFPQARVVFEGSRARLAGFVGQQNKGNGRLELEGAFNFSASDDSLFALRLVADDLDLRVEDTFRAPDLTADISFKGGLLSSVLDGRLHLRNAVATPALVEFNAPPVPPPPPTVEDAFLENMRLGLFIEILNLGIDSELAKASLGGSIDVGGTFYKPTFQGGINIAEGHAFLLGHRFDFTRGRIGFNRLGPTESILDLSYDPSLLDPELDIEAVTEVTPLDDEDEYKVAFSLQGRALGVVPEFHSDPILDTGQILYLLAFNTIDSGSNSNYTARALGTTAGQLIGSRVSQVGFDEFSVVPSGAALGTVNKPSILVGKYFKNFPLPLWVRYEAALAEISAGEVRLERRLNSYITITGSAQSAYDRYGVGVGLKKEY
jgi:hypothetical protein